MMWVSFLEWMAAECPLPDLRIMERAAEIAWSMVWTRAKARTGQSF
jgi:hypothetical protein